jgi:tetratricopeptide (TPR) repeat protein
LFGLAAGVLGASSVHADEQLDDLAGRIEYAFYSGDSASLQQDLQSMEKLEVAPGDHEQYSNYLNYGRWKLAQLLAHDNSAQAQKQAERCADADLAGKPGILLAMQQAVRAACLGTLEQLRPLRSALYHGSRTTALEQAQLASAKSPEVQFVTAWLALRKDHPDSAYALLTNAVEHYAAAETEAHPGVPRWGYAEACYWLGRAEMARGNALAARNMLERALVLAPDYRDAHQALQSLNVK